MEIKSKDSIIVKIRKQRDDYRGIIDSSKDLTLFFQIKSDIDSIKTAARSLFTVYKIDLKLDTLLNTVKKEQK